MDTIAMDTNPFVAGAARAVEDAFTQRDRALPRAWVTATLRNERFPARRGQANDGANRASCAPLANAHSPRDNYTYRASFTR